MRNRPWFERHREERSDAAIHGGTQSRIATAYGLAMTFFALWPFRAYPQRPRTRAAFPWVYGPAIYAALVFITLATKLGSNPWECRREVL